MKEKDFFLKLCQEKKQGKHKKKENCFSIDHKSELQIKYNYRKLSKNRNIPLY